MDIQLNEEEQIKIELEKELEKAKREYNEYVNAKKEDLDCLRKSLNAIFSSKKTDVKSFVENQFEVEKEWIQEKIKNNFEHDSLRFRNLIEDTTKFFLRSNDFRYVLANVLEEHFDYITKREKEKAEQKLNTFENYLNLIKKNFPNASDNAIAELIKKFDKI